MQTLQRLLAQSAVDALQDREHIIVAPGSTDALLAELETAIAPCMATLQLGLVPGPKTLDAAPRSSSRPRASSKGVTAVIDAMARCLMASDHVDDIFADDRALRRDALRAIELTLRLNDCGAFPLDTAPQLDVAARISRAVPLSSPPPPPSAVGYDSPWEEAPEEAATAAGAFGPRAPCDDEHVEYFLGNLERALAVLGEEGEGPASAPAGLCLSDTEPPRPPPSPARPKARGWAQDTTSPPLHGAAHTGVLGLGREATRPRLAPRNSEPRACSASTAALASLRPEGAPSARRTKPQRKARSAASAAATPCATANGRARPARSSKRPPRR